MPLLYGIDTAKGCLKNQFSLVEDKEKVASIKTVDKRKVRKEGDKVFSRVG